MNEHNEGVGLLKRLLNKLGKNYEDLTPSAKLQYDMWERALTGHEVTVDSLLESMKTELEIITNRLGDISLIAGSPEDLALKADLRLSKFVLNTLQAPNKARQQVERHIKQKHGL